MVTAEGDLGLALLFFVAGIAISIFVIRMGVLSITRELRRLTHEVSHLNRTLDSRGETAPEP